MSIAGCFLQENGIIYLYLYAKMCLYCGVIVNLFCQWLAATPDRNIYAPDRNSPFELLEIKCPGKNNESDVKCLHIQDDELKININLFEK